MDFEAILVAKRYWLTRYWLLHDGNGCKEATCSILWFVVCILISLGSSSVRTQPTDLSTRRCATSNLCHRQWGQTKHCCRKSSCMKLFRLQSDGDAFVQQSQVVLIKFVPRILYTMHDFRFAVKFAAQMFVCRCAVHNENHILTYFKIWSCL